MYRRQLSSTDLVELTMANIERKLMLMGYRKLMSNHISFVLQKAPNFLHFDRLIHPLLLIYVQFFLIDY